MRGIWGREVGRNEGRESKDNDGKYIMKVWEVRVVKVCEVWKVMLRESKGGREWEVYQLMGIREGE